MNGERRKMTLHKLRLRIQNFLRTIYGRVIFSVVSKTIIIFQFARFNICMYSNTDLPCSHFFVNLPSPSSQM